MSDQYTFQTHLNVVANKRTTEQVMTPHLVQARKRGIVYCASIMDYVTFASGLELWKLNCTSPESFVGYFQPKNIRACGDKNCTCIVAQAAASERFSAASAACPTNELEVRC